MMKPPAIIALSLCGLFVYVLGISIRQHKFAAFGLVIATAPVNLILLEMFLTLWRMKR